tara:strand:- start:155 stop:274 length:120 start_codon:yes stop_codon:yes gene_type:complete
MTVAAQPVSQIVLTVAGVLGMSVRQHRLAVTVVLVAMEE